MDSKIKAIDLRKIFDSSGNFTVEATVRLNGESGTASAPSGKSKGIHEVIAFPENSVDLGIRNFAEISKRLIGTDATEQATIDAILEENFGRIGGNVSSAVSIATAKAAASSLGIELYEYVYDKYTKKLGIRRSVPRPLGNVIGGGIHSQNSHMSIQEILIATESPNAEKNVMVNSEFHRIVGQEAAKKTAIPLGVNIERAWVLPFDEGESFELVSAVREELEERHNVRISLGMDIAASSLFKDGLYFYKDKKLSPGEQLEFLEDLCKKYRITIIEDPFGEESFEDFAKLTASIGDSSLIVGDDLYVTNVERIEEGAKVKATNAVLIKVNQIGTLTKTIRAIEAAGRHGMKTIISHRSSETTDPFIAHLGVAFGCTYIKTGTVGGERVSKLNELIRIQKMTG